MTIKLNKYIKQRYYINYISCSPELKILYVISFLYGTKRTHVLGNFLIINILDHYVCGGLLDLLNFTSFTFLLPFELSSLRASLAKRLSFSIFPLLSSPFPFLQFFLSSPLFSATTLMPLSDHS